MFIKKKKKKKSLTFDSYWLSYIILSVIRYYREEWERETEWLICLVHIEQVDCSSKNDRNNKKY